MSVQGAGGAARPLHTHSPCWARSYTRGGGETVIAPQKPYLGSHAPARFASPAVTAQSRLARGRGVTRAQGGRREI